MKRLSLLPLTALALGRSALKLTQPALNRASPCGFKPVVNLVPFGESPSTAALVPMRQIAVQQLAQTDVV
jgi:hypothetical protein